VRQIILEDAERLIIAARNERQAALMPMLFSPTIGAAIAARYNGGSAAASMSALYWLMAPLNGSKVSRPKATQGAGSRTSQ
jgi:hypothetical protein